jgi:release factor glutamine methyltransferase
VTIREALAQASQRLAATTESPRLDAELLLAHVLKKSRAALLARPEEPLAAADAQAFDALLQRRLADEPVAYLIGHWEFWSLPLKITPDVLVPRPETELLVRWALEISRTLQPRHIADLGTGSGAIAFALAKELPDAHVIAVDRSASALAVARANGAALRLANVAFFQENFAAFFTDTGVQGGMFDLIVSNPPYVAAGDPHLQKLTHEPSGALTAGADGLSCLRAIVAGAPARLRSGGWLLVEHGYQQGADVRALFAAPGFDAVETRRDLSGNERATGARIP